MKNGIVIGLLLLLYSTGTWANPDLVNTNVGQKKFVVHSVDSLVLTVKLDDSDGIYLSPQQVSFSILSDVCPSESGFNLICLVTADTYSSVDSLCFFVRRSKEGKLSRRIAFTPPAAGFYRISVYAENKTEKSRVKTFTIGYNPEQIVSPSDAKADFDEFWKRTRSELDSIPPRYKMTLIEEKCSDTKNMYHVEMYSLGNVKIEGYYSVPKKGGKHPANIRFQGYGANPRFPVPDALPDFCEFILSVRGQGIQKSQNVYGEWILNGLSDKDSYYYRGAYMDLIRGIDFLVSRPEVDTKNIMAEGASQGGAFTLVACALDNRIRAAAPRIPFLSDFKDYFRICTWPRSLFENYLRKHPNKNWEEIYDLLSYFDVKNMAKKISCPIIMAVGLQDETCPPHTNFSGYNLVRSEKKYIVYPQQKHNVDDTWWADREIFFRKNLYKGFEEKK